jgi:hypothetical protein
LLGGRGDLAGLAEHAAGGGGGVGGLGAEHPAVGRGALDLADHLVVEALAALGEPLALGAAPDQVEMGGEHLGLEQGRGGEAARQPRLAVGLAGQFLGEDLVAFGGGGVDRREQGGETHPRLACLGDEGSDHVGPFLIGDVGIFGGHVGEDPGDEPVELGALVSGADLGRGSEMDPEALRHSNRLFSEQGRYLAARGLKLAIAVEPGDPPLDLHLLQRRRHVAFIPSLETRRSPSRSEGLTSC